MKIIQETCGNCNGFGEIIYYKPDKSIDNIDCRTAHAVREKCKRCGGRGYVEEYVTFTIKEAQIIFKHCDLSTEN